MNQLMVVIGRVGRWNNMAGDVKDARQHARDEINRLEYEVELLVEQLEEQQNEQIEEDFHENISLR